MSLKYLARPLEIPDRGSEESSYLRLIDSYLRLIDGSRVYLARPLEIPNRVPLLLPLLGELLN